MSDFNLLIDGQMVPGRPDHARPQPRDRGSVGAVPARVQRPVGQGGGRGQGRLSGVGGDPELALDAAHKAKEAWGLPAA